MLPPKHTFLFHLVRWISFRIRFKLFPLDSVDGNGLTSSESVHWHRVSKSFITFTFRGCINSPRPVLFFNANIEQISVAGHHLGLDELQSKLEKFPKKKTDSNSMQWDFGAKHAIQVTAIVHGHSTRHDGLYGVRSATCVASALKISPAICSTSWTTNMLWDGLKRKLPIDDDTGTIRERAAYLARISVEHDESEMDGTQFSEYECRDALGLPFSISIPFGEQVCWIECELGVCHPAVHPSTWTYPDGEQSCCPSETLAQSTSDPPKWTICLRPVKSLLEKWIWGKITLIAFVLFDSVENNSFEYASNGTIRLECSIMERVCKINIDSVCPRVRFHYWHQSPSLRIC